MEASAPTVRYHGVDESDADNSVEGVSGYDKDDQDPSNTRHHRDLVALVSAFQKVLSSIAQERVKILWRGLVRIIRDFVGNFSDNVHQYFMCFMWISFSSMFL